MRKKDNLQNKEKEPLKAVFATESLMFKSIFSKRSNQAKSRKKSLIVLCEAMVSYLEKGGVNPSTIWKVLGHVNSSRPLGLRQWQTESDPLWRKESGQRKKVGCSARSSLDVGRPKVGLGLGLQGRGRRSLGPKRGGGQLGPFGPASSLFS